MNATSEVRLPATLNDLFLLAMMLAMAAILTTAMMFQYRGGEIPCPLCLLQRVAMFGVCFGIMLHFRDGASARHDALSMLFALFLLIVSARQTLLDIYPRAGHGYVGTAIFGIYMPVWSVIVSVAILLAYTIKIAVLGGENVRDDEKPELMSSAQSLLSYYMIALCAINFISVIVQCGMQACHTTGYKLL